MTNAAVGSVQIVGWSLTAAGISANLIWNFFNQRRTIKLADRLRIEQYRTTQWSRIRGKIDSALDGLIEATSLDFKQTELLEEEKSAAVVIDFINQLIVSAQDALASALSEAAESAYCCNLPWEDAANGKRIGHETSWDILVARLAEVDTKTDGKGRRSALTALRGPVSQIRKSVQELCRIQDTELDPEKI